MMLSPEIQMLMTALILAGGAGLFLRIVGNEKHRRQQWLQFRLEEQLKELKQAQNSANAVIAESNDVIAIEDE